MKIVYPAKFESDEDGRIVVTFRDLPEAMTDGANMEEARAEAIDVLNSVLMFRMKFREDVPPPSRIGRGEELVTPDTEVAMKIALYITMREHGMTAAELSRALGVDYREAQRILNPEHSTKTTRMRQAIEAAGSQAIIEVRKIRKVSRPQRQAHAA